ncbi:4Fe-4S dicluster domain-containing protein [Ferrimonas sediminum]|uniref:4Fe-4S dicluster domain-containing protein n=1 Tax=Ferrimonas sediminum TaxID=718193 RepID=A0A1G8RAM8_9GAMM|nr:4Fe-4S dicluster domain-containing protein [Ferrimonas sediminum]SDJ14114.1 4Fe-4S dicluster domain-containing protein [Ferrimonas sediminum]
MGIVKLLFRNLLKGPSTDPFPFGDTFTPKALRGRIEFDASRCTGCRMCEYVCAGGAIRFQETDAGLKFHLWHNSCAFCGLCEHYCVPGAIRMTQDWHLAHPQQEKYTMVEQGVVRRLPCEGCQVAMVPTTERLIGRAYAGSNAAIESLSRLCPDCRRQRSARQLTKGELL